MGVAAIAAVTALVAGGISVTLILLLHFVEPEYDPSWRMISEYSLGRHGWIMRVAFIAMAVSPAAICVALWPFGGAWTIGLAIVAVGALGAAFVDADPIMTPRAQATRVGMAHSVLGSVLLVGFPVAALRGGNRVGGRTRLDARDRLRPCVGRAWCGSSSPRRRRADSAARLEVRVGWPDRACLVVYLAWVALAAALVLSWS